MLIQVLIQVLIQAWVQVQTQAWIQVSIQVLIQVLLRLSWLLTVALTLELVGNALNIVDGVSRADVGAAGNPWDVNLSGAVVLVRRELHADLYGTWY